MLCKTASPGSTYNKLRKQDNCNVIVIMRDDYADDYKPNYVLDGNSITTSGVWNSRKFDNNFNLKDDPCETLSNSKFTNLNDSINNRQNQQNMAHTFHLSSAVFKPYGYDVVWPNFVDDSRCPRCQDGESIKNIIDTTTNPDKIYPIVKMNAKVSLRHWTKERVYIVVISYQQLVQS